MYRTPYSSANADLTERAHEVAKRQLYPLLFKTQALQFESTLVGTSEKNTILDGQMGVDRIVKATVGDLHAPLSFTIQERFRRREYSKYKDLTITEFNHNSGQVSELYKMTCGLFLYGYFDDRQHAFIEAIAVSVPCLLLKIVGGDVDYVTRRNPRSNQTFFAFTFKALKEAGVVRFHYADPSLFA